MPYIPFVPIGSALHLDATTRIERIDHVQTTEHTLEQQRSTLREGWGDKYQARVHAKGRLTARERLALLHDADAPLLEVGTFVHWGETFGKGLSAPAAGVITLLTRIHQRWCVVIANDNTVASGAWWPLTPAKIQRAQQVALRLRLPVLYLVDCSGLFLPEQARSFAGAKGAGHIFKLNSQLSDAGVPQMAGVFGDCIAGGGYMPIISDRVYMTEQAYMVIAGAALLRGAKGQTTRSLDMGGPEVHVHASRCADARFPDDRALLKALRRDVATLPSSACAYYRAGGEDLPPQFETTELESIFPRDHREAYDAMQVLARLCDQSLFWEFLPQQGAEVICGVGRLQGLTAAFVLNRQGLLSASATNRGQRVAGILYRDGIAKLNAFTRACNDDGIPLFWLHDISGFDIGHEAEQQGLLAYGSNLIYANSTHSTPSFSVLLRKASGAGYYALQGLPYDPVLQLATCFSRLTVMEGRTLAIATYRSRLDENFNIISNDPDERRAIEQGMAEVEQRIEADLNPYAVAARMHVDELIKLRELRHWLCALAEMSYQSIGYRRIKTLRIASLHDLSCISGSS